jgi:tight adherence protein B
MSEAAAVAASAAGLTGWLLAPGTTVGAVEREGRHVRLATVTVLVFLLVPVHGLVVPCLVLAAGVWCGRSIWNRRSAARAAESGSLRMAEVCDLIASELSAGRPAEAALDEAADSWSAVRPVAEACRLGGDVPAAFREVARIPGAGGLRLLAAAWTVSQRTGGGLGSATRRVADAVRRDQATRRMVSGELASARATARLVAGLPVLALLMGSGAGADPWSFLLRTSWGWLCLASGLAVGFAGLWWIELIAREAEP